MKLWVFAATAVGAFLRFTNLWDNPLWIDEALLGVGALPHQEFLGNLLVVHDDYWLRFPYALAGTLTIPALFYVMENKRFAVAAGWFVAVFPLFVFWSRLARPYALAGLFVVLAWRWWWAMWPGLACSPVALLGMRLRKSWTTPVLIASALILYLVRPDGDARFFDPDFFLTQPRIWYVPILVVLLWCGDYLVPWLGGRNSFRAKCGPLVDYPDPFCRLEERTFL